VDYLQKVHIEERHESSRIGRIANSLKDIALDTGQVVLAVSALDRKVWWLRASGPGTSRARSPWPTEADVILVVQRKWDVVAREQLVFNLSLPEAARLGRRVDREEPPREDRIDLAFRKRLSAGTSTPNGRVEEDVLVDERLHVDR